MTRLATSLFIPVFALFELSLLSIFFFFFFNDTATTEIYTLSLTTLFRSQSQRLRRRRRPGLLAPPQRERGTPAVRPQDRKSTRLNSSHLVISYAVFCLKKKNNDYISYSLNALSVLNDYHVMLFCYEDCLA